MLWPSKQSQFRKKEVETPEKLTWEVGEHSGTVVGPTPIVSKSNHSLELAVGSWFLGSQIPPFAMQAYVKFLTFAAEADLVSLMTQDPQN